MTDVVLAVMPFVEVCRPSAAASLLQAILERDGLSCQVLYGCLRMARRMGLPRYQRIGSGLWHLEGYGELVFSRCLFPEHPLDGETLGRLLGDRPERVLDRLVADVEMAEGLLEEMADAVLALGPRILGCTSTFQQHLPSLALLERVRRRDPSVATMLGGANCEGEMGAATHRLFPQVDFVVSGEADGLLVPLCRAILAGDVAEVPEGVFARGARPPSLRAVYSDLDGLPVPDFRDYFRELAECGLADRVTVGLPVEASRGCWWGRCTFCGLNGLGLSHRAKSPDRILAELEELEDRHGIPRFMLCDNVLEMRAFTTWLPGVRRSWSLFAEVKSNLRDEHLEVLARSGMRWLQPGIESLHTQLLARIRKGVQAWQQVQLLKLAREHGLNLVWNLLTGLPGEEDEWHLEVARLLPSLHHLAPPASVTEIRYDRFSDLFEHAEELGLDLEPHPLSALYHPFPEADRRALAYHFQRRDRPLDRPCPTPGTRALAEAVDRWRRAFHPLPPTLWGRDRAGCLEVTDTRPEGGAREWEAGGLERAVLLAASVGHTPAVLARECAPLLGRAPSHGELRVVLEGLEARRLVVGLDGRWLSLVLRESTPPWSPPRDFPGGEVRDRAPSAEDPFRRLFGLP